MKDVVFWTIYKKASLKKLSVSSFDLQLLFSTVWSQYLNWRTDDVPLTSLRAPLNLKVGSSKQYNEFLFKDWIQYSYAVDKTLKGVDLFSVFEFKSSGVQGLYFKGKFSKIWMLFVKSFVC